MSDGRGPIVSSLPDSMLPLSTVGQLMEEIESPRALFPLVVYDTGGEDLVVSLIYATPDDQVITAAYSPDMEGWQRIETYPPGTTIAETTNAAGAWLEREFGEAAGRLAYVDIEKIFRDMFPDGLDGDEE